ncbi:MAG: ABC transporter ATP-binding protein [Oscillospiraceae bacterium]|jgi:ATP-binding cassette subfamily B multidrug efflux pump
MKVLKYLKHHKLEILLILCLLVVQAYSELSLPSYTSDIVDVGIQNGGIEYATPEQLRAETMEQLQLFLSEEDIQTITAAYDLNDGIYTLRNSENLETLSPIFGTAEVMLAQISSWEEYDINQIQMALESGMMTKDQLLHMTDQAMESMGTLSDTIINSAAVQFVQSEYEAMGLDLEEIRMDYLWSVGLRMIALTILMVAAAIAVGYIGSRLAASVGRELRERVFYKVVSFSSTELDHFSTASLITRSTNDIQQIQMVSILLVRIVLYAPILGIGGILKVSATKTGMGWIIAVAVGAMLLLIGILIAVAMPKFKKMQELIDRLNLVSREILSGLPVIRAFHREKHEEARFDSANTNLMKTQLFTGHTMAFMMPSMMFIMYGVTVMIEWFGAKGIDLGNLQVGDMIAFITYSMMIVMAFMMITMIAIFLPRASVAADRIDEVLNTEPVIEDPTENQDDCLTDATGLVSFNHVSFRYPGAEDNVLSDISFVAEPGKTTAIIGSTGCGKSTLVNLIPRFYDVSEGSICIDGIDIRDLSQHKLHALLGYVPQKGILFSGNIESNLKFGGDNISDEAMVQAAEIAQASDFISEDDAGFQRAIAQGGTNVSGGQKQRLSIARAIAKHPKIYIFDDSFSALDYKTDLTLRKALHAHVSDATVLIVAQRISTILHADQIVVLDAGKLVGIGTHETLLQSCTAYQEIARSQLSAKELGEEA